MLISLVIGADACCVGRFSRECALHMVFLFWLTVAVMLPVPARADNVDRPVSSFNRVGIFCTLAQLIDVFCTMPIITVQLRLFYLSCKKKLGLLGQKPSVLRQRSLCYMSYICCCEQCLQSDYPHILQRLKK